MNPAAAVLVAAGRGRRMAGEAKQFRRLGGRPVVCWAARPLLRALSGPVVVVLPEDAMAEGEDLLRAHLGGDADRLLVAAGGERRQDSVRAGLDALQGAATVLVHDAARPFASPELAGLVAVRAGGGRAVVPVLPIPDTLKEIEGTRVVRTHDRTRFALAQTPQGFPTATLTAALGDHTDATDCAALCERAGVAVQWIPGEPLNRKLTDVADWSWAEQVIEAGWIRWEESA